MHSKGEPFSSVLIVFIFIPPFKQTRGGIQESLCLSITKGSTVYNLKMCMNEDNAGKKISRELIRGRK